MKNLSNKTKDFLMRIPTFLVIAAIIFDSITYLEKIAGIALIISSILLMIDLYKNKSHFSKYIIYIILVIAGIYLLFS